MKYLTPTLLALSLASCWSVKKSISKQKQEVKGQHEITTDSSGSTLSSSIQVNHDSVVVRKLWENGQEIETQETVIDWITTTPVKVDSNLTIPAGTRTTYSRRTSKERGQSKAITNFLATNADSSRSTFKEQTDKSVKASSAWHGVGVGITKEVERKGIPWGLLLIIIAALIWWKRKWLLLRVFGIK